MKTMKALATLAALSACLASSADGPSLSEITVDLRMDETEYVSGERIRATVDIKNMSPFAVSCGRPASPDRFYIEVFYASDMRKLDKLSSHPFVAPFRIEMNQGQTLETHLGDHYYMLESRSYIARPVLIHRNHRYEGRYRAFDVVPGTEMSKALQLFANHEGLSREFTLLRWPRSGSDHIFLTFRDLGERERAGHTTDIGPLMRTTEPVISILPGGEVLVLHRSGIDSFVRSEFWSMPNLVELRSRQLVMDPDTAGQTSVQEMYRKSGGVKAAPRPWWKFW